MKSAVLLKILIATSLIVGTQNASIASSANPKYVLGPGDVLSIKDNDGTVTKAPVLTDGTAVINYAGVIAAAGLTIHDINDVVNEAAKKWFASPHIEVTLDHRRLAQVYILGAVTHPGLYSLAEQLPESPNANLKSKERFTISKVLEMAGGLKDGADIKHLHVTRLHPKMVIDVNLSKILKDGDVTEDLVLEPGDVVYIPVAGTESGITNDAGKIIPVENKIRVMGAVKNPGLVIVSEDGKELSLVIAAVGGFNYENASYTIFVARIARDGSIRTERIAVDNNQHYADQSVKAGDIIVVKPNTINGLKNVLPIPNIPGFPQMPIGDFDPPYMHRIKP